MLLPFSYPLLQSCKSHNSWVRARAISYIPIFPSHMFFCFVGNLEAVYVPYDISHRLLCNFFQNIITLILFYVKEFLTLRLIGFWIRLCLKAYSIKHFNSQS